MGTNSGEGKIELTACGHAALHADASPLCGLGALSVCLTAVRCHEADQRVLDGCSQQQTAIDESPLRSVVSKAIAEPEADRKIGRAEALRRAPPWSKCPPRAG
jgi:hypothetical protein